MKSPKIKGIGEVATEYGAKVMKVIKKGLLGRSLFDFYGDVKANALRVKESSSVPLTPNDKDGGVVYVKNSDGKLYYKSNEVAEVELSAHTGLSTEEVQDIAGVLSATGGTKTGIAVTYDDTNGNMDFVVDHDAATNFVAAEHVDWAASGAGTIHADNYIENVVQTTVTGSSGTVTSIGNLTGDVTSSNRSTTIASAAVHHGMLNDDVISGQGSVTTMNQSDLLVMHEISAGTVNNITFSKFEDTIFGNVSSDVTVASGGAATIAADAVTYSKMQDVSATNVVLGRDSSGAGIVEEISAANLRTMINVEDGSTSDQTQADINGLAITTVGTIGTGVWQGTTIKTAYIGDDQVTEDKLSNTLLAEIDANTAKATNVSTDLTLTANSSRFTVVSSDGDNVDLTLADTNNWGVMSDEMFDEHTANNAKNTNVVQTSVTGNAGTATALVSGDQTIGGDLTVSGGVITRGSSDNLDVVSGRILKLTHADNYDAQIGNATNQDTLVVNGVDQTVTINGSLYAKQLDVFNQSFHDDLSTTKHYLPWSGTLEQSSNTYQEEVAMIAPCGGRIVSCTVRTNSITGSGNMTIGIQTREAGAAVGSGWVSEETEVLAITSTDDNHVFHFVFDNAKHFEAGELIAMSIQNSSDLSSYTYWYTTTVVEWDWNDLLGTSSGEHD